MGSRVTKKPSHRPETANLGKVIRAGGTIQMIEFAEYLPSGSAPNILVNKVLGIYRLQPSLIKCTFGLESATVSGMMRVVEAANLIWTDEHAWLEASDIFKFATAEVRKGTFQNAIPDDGGGRRPRTQ